MKYARIQVLAETPPGGLTAGIGWGSADHAVCVVDTAGQAGIWFTVAHDRAGIGKLIAGLRAAGAVEAAIERSDGVLVQALPEAGLTVVVITSRQMKNLRSRYGSAGAKDDRFGAFVLADALRTDRARLRPLVADTPATAALRAAVRARRDLVAHRIAACNQLRAHGSLIRFRLCSPPGQAGQGRSLRSRRRGDGASATLDSPTLPGGFRQLSDEALSRLSSQCQSPARLDWAVMAGLIRLLPGRQDHQQERLRKPTGTVNGQALRRDAAGPARP